MGIPELSYSVYGNRHNRCRIFNAGTRLLLPVSQCNRPLIAVRLHYRRTSDIVRFVYYGMYSSQTKLKYQMPATQNFSFFLR